MDVKVTTLDGKAAGKLTLADAIFGLEPREDILHRMVRFQMLKRMRGTHDVKNRAEVAFTTKKFGRQKGGGTARHGSRKSPIFRKGGRAFGPTPRSHAIELPKKVRAMALKHALSTKAKAGDLMVVDAVTAENAKTSALKVTFAKLGLADALFVGGAELDQNFAKAARNIPGIDVLPAQGINVYDILRRRTLVLSKAAVEALEARFA